MTIQAIVFDLDDTLYPEWDYVRSGFAAVAETYAGSLNASFDIAARMEALSRSPQRGRVFNVVCREAGVEDPDAWAARMVQTYREHAPDITMFPDAKAALERYRGRYRLGLISDGYLVTQNAKLDALGIWEAFDIAILTDQWGREFWKPHPHAFRVVMDELAIAPESLVYVADNPAKDFVAPNRLGWHTVHVLRPGGVHADGVPPTDGQPLRKIHSLDELDGLLSDTA